MSSNSLIPSDCVIINRDTLRDVVDQSERMAQFLLSIATDAAVFADFLAQFANDFGSLGEAHFCCHGGSPTAPNVDFCTNHTSYSIALAKAWCIANVQDYNHISKGSCNKSDGCGFIDGNPAIAG
jgi:hypothetical protein